MLTSEKVNRAIGLLDKAGSNPEDNSKMLWDRQYFTMRDLLVDAYYEIRDLEQRGEVLSPLERWLQEADDEH
ncbi:MAG TPA: hypothetical protein VM537_15410 [Anaerolineae bacterium]|nr:hypothetical protein [Anaerolineae bacterium]